MHASVNIKMNAVSAIARPSSYRKSYEAEMSVKKTSVSVTNEAVQNKESEREQMVRLNSSLTGYIDKVHDLEDMVKKLSVENSKLVKRCKKEKKEEIDYKKIYEPKLQVLRKKVENLQAANVKQSIKRDNKQFECEKTTVEFASKESKSRVLKKEIEALRGDVDDSKMERENLEDKIKMLTEQIATEKKVHENEIKNLRDQMVPDIIPEFTPQDSIMPDISKAIDNIRKEHEKLNAKSLEDLDNFYKVKVDKLSLQVKTLHLEVGEHKNDSVVNRQIFQKVENEMVSLKHKNITLEKTIEGLEAQLKVEGLKKGELLAQTKQQLQEAKVDLGKYLKQYEELNMMKLSLDKEITMYRKLITGESERITEVETSMVESSSSSSSSDEN